MSDTIGRIIKRVTPGFVLSDSDPFQYYRALASVTGHMVTSDLNHMGDESTYRTLWTHPGFAGFWAGSPSGSTAAAPTVSDIDWQGTYYNADGRTASACCGVAWVVRVGAGITLPKAVLRCRAACGTKGGSAIGLYFGVGAGADIFPSQVSNHASVRITSSTLASQTLTIQLTEADLQPLVVTPSPGYTATGVPPVEEPVRLMVCTLWFGANNSWNNNAAGEPGSVFGITVGLEP